MKVLIAILSCHELRHYENSIRETWGKEVPADVDLRFFLGNPGTPAADEVFLTVGDTLHDLTHKTVAVCAWALAQGYDFMLKVDLDTLVRPLRLLESDFKQFDWVGGRNSTFASGGAGYTLSRRAMKVVVDYPVSTAQEEDVHVARALLAEGIELHHDPRFLFIPGSVLTADAITYHLSSVKAWDAKATTADMYSAYAGTFKLPQHEVPERRWLRRPR
jgi:hypothetical protein